MADTRMEVVISLKDQISDKLKLVSGQVKGLGDTITKNATSIRNTGLALTGFATAAGLAFTSTIKESTKLTESINAVNVIFGEGAKTIHDFGKIAATSAGVATSEFNQMATVTGALLQDVGLPMTEVADITKDLTMRAADMASVMNTNVSDALSAINQALRGETEAIRRYAGDVTDATIEQYMLSKGIEVSVTEMTEQEKRLARLQVIMSQSEKFAGDFSRTSGELANQQRILSSQLKNLSAEIGKGLQPMLLSIIATITPLVNAISEWIGKNPELAATISVVIASLTAMVFVVGTLAVGLGMAAAAATALGVTLSVFFGWVVGIAVGIVALIALLVVLVKNWDAIKSAVIGFAQSATQAIGSFVDFAYEKLQTGFQGIQDFFITLWENIKNIFETVLGIIKNVITFWVSFVIGIFQTFFDLFGIDFVATMIQFSTFLSAKLTEITTFVQNFLNTFIAIWGKTFATIKQTYITIWEGIKGITSDVFTWIVNLITTMSEPIVKVFTALWEKVKDVTVSIFTSITDTIKGMINNVFEMINKLIRAANKIAEAGGSALGISVPKIPEIPMLAKGGIVKNPTLAMVGEAGPEAVVPLNRASEFGLGGGVNVYINEGNFLGDEREIAMMLGDIILKEVDLATQTR
jgi:phage-related protein